MALPVDMNFSKRVHAQGLAKAKETLTEAPQNGVDFVCGTGLMTFHIGGNQPARYADFSSLYIACDITNANANSIMFSHIGTMGLVSRIVVSTLSNTTIADISYKNQLDAILIAKQGDTNWLATNGSVMFGCGASAVGGLTIASNATKRLLIPISLIGIDQMMFPLFANETLRFQIYLDAAKTAFTTDTAAHTGLTNADITLSNVLLHYDISELSPKEDAQLISDFNGLLVMNVPIWQCIDTEISTTATTASIPLNYAKTRCRRLLMSQVNSTFIANDTTCSFAMDQALTTEISLKLAGKEIKTQAFTLSNGAPEIFAESIKTSCGRILDIHPSSTTYTNYNVAQTAAATVIGTDTTCGRFYLEVDLQNGLENLDGTITDGLNIVNGNLALSLKRSAGTTAARKVYCFMEHWADIVLDVRLGKWQVYV